MLISPTYFLRYRVDEITGVDVVVFDRPFVPNFVDGLIVENSKITEKWSELENQHTIFCCGLYLRFIFWIFYVLGEVLPSGKTAVSRHEGYDDADFLDQFSSAWNRIDLLTNSIKKNDKNTGYIYS